MYSYIKYGNDIFLEHVHIPHSILGNFFDRMLSVWGARNWASNAVNPTDSTQSSTIYKLIGELAH
jgi:hypothetical protein